MIGVFRPYKLGSTIVKEYIFCSKRHPLDYNWDELDPELKIASVGGF